MFLRVSSLLVPGKRLAILVPRAGAKTGGDAVVSKDIPDPIEHATGYEKQELLAKLSGDERYESKSFVIDRHATKEKPNLVPSHFDKRLIGCICTEDQLHINWMYLILGHTKRCSCGHWFKLVEADPESFGSYKPDQKF